MRLSRLAVLAAAALASAACHQPAPASSRRAPLRVLTYNIHAGRDATGGEAIARVAQVVRESGADVVLLQEVDVKTRRSGGVDQPAELSRLTGMHVAFGRSLVYDGGDYGIAILSRFPIATQRVIPLVTEPPADRAAGSREPRVALRVTLRMPDGSLGVLNTHVGAEAADTWRVQEAADLVAATRAASEPGEAPVVLAGGDLNSEPGSATQDVFARAGWHDLWPTCGGGAGLSYPADVPRKRIDYLYAIGTRQCRRAEVVATDASDHRPVLFELQ